MSVCAEDATQRGEVCSIANHPTCSELRAPTLAQGDRGDSCVTRGSAAPLTRRRSSGPTGAGERSRGKGIARPEQPREPKQSWRAQSPHASMFAIATARQVCRAADSQQAQSRVAWARAAPRDRCDLDHTVVAWPGVAVISSLPAHALLPIVRSESRAVQRADACSRTEASVVVSRLTPDDRYTSRTSLMAHASVV